MSPLAGEVRIQARLRAGRLGEVQVASVRPALARLLAGRPAREAPGWIARLYSICARAQEAAARAALQAAAGATPAPMHDPAVATEALRERLVAVFDGQPAPLLASAVRAAATPAHLRELLEHEALGFGLAALLDADGAADLAVLAARSEAPLAMALRGRLAAREPAPAATRELPSAPAAVLAGLPYPLSDANCAAPTWQGAPAGTGPLARAGEHPALAALAGRPLLQHWWARLREVAAAAGGAGEGDDGTACGSVAARTVAPGVGRAAVVTARGLLLHEVEVDGDSVRRYAILAPTEWNFHPLGALPAWLEGAGVADEADARALVKACAGALDPCVPCTMRMVA